MTVLSKLLGVNKEWLQTGEGSKYTTVATDTSYTQIFQDPEGKHMNEKLILILDRLTESMREKDQQISMLINQMNTSVTHQK